MQIIIDIDENIYTRLFDNGVDNYDDAVDMAKAIRKGTSLPKVVTNGDMMKTMFPNIDFHDMAFTVHATTNVTSNGVKGSISYDFWKEWWNAPYRAEKEE